MSNASKQEFIVDLEKIIATLQEDYSGKSFPLEGKTWKTVDIVGVCQSAITAMTAVDPAKVAYADAVDKQKTAVAAARMLVAALKAYIGAISGKGSPEYKSFGFGVKPASPTAQTKVAAIRQRQATRIARGTMGKRQRKAIKGVVTPASAQPAASSTPQPGATTPVSGTTPTNGVKS